MEWLCVYLHIIIVAVGGDSVPPPVAYIWERVEVGVDWQLSTTVECVAMPAIKCKVFSVPNLLTV